MSSDESQPEPPRDRSSRIARWHGLCWNADRSESRAVPRRFENRAEVETERLAKSDEASRTMRLRNLAG